MLQSKPPPDLPRAVVVAPGTAIRCTAVSRTYTNCKITSLLQFDLLLVRTINSSYLYEQPGTLSTNVAVLSCINWTYIASNIYFYHFDKHQVLYRGA